MLLDHDLCQVSLAKFPLHIRNTEVRIDNNLLCRLASTLPPSQICAHVFTSFTPHTYSN